MDSRGGGCCIARYAGGGYDRSKVDRIMLRFRPIAPKPATGGSGFQNTELYSKSVRSRKRKQPNSSNNNNKNNKRHHHNRNRKSSSEENKADAAAAAAAAEVVEVVTLPLLPETPDRKDWSPVEQEELIRNVPIPMWLDFGGSRRTDHQTTVVKDMMGSCVTVECVTDTWMDGNGLGVNDEERRMNLEKDTCPGFISDGFGRVTWTNEAYRKMVGGGEDQEDMDMMVWLMMKEEVLPVTVTMTMLTYPAFTCRVRLQYYTCGKEKSSLTLPCDVWRMECGGFAWRLDVKAALCLGR